MTDRRIAHIFPGQGAQYPGIGADLYAQLQIVRDTYAEASDALGLDMVALSQHAPPHELNLTRNTQPVLLAHSIACLRALTERAGHAARIAAGHSLGEYCALVDAGALSFARALRLVKKRGELMGEYGRGEMLALMLDYPAADELARRHYCEIAARNLPEQNVIGGAREDLDAVLREMAEKYPRKRAAKLKTEGAFHTYYMIEAAMKFRETLAETKFNDLKFGVMSNFTGELHDANAESIKSRLFFQLFKPVLWQQNLTAVSRDADVLIEFGGGLGGGELPGDKRPNLEGMVKKTRGKDVNYLAVINTRTLDNAVAAFAAN